MKIYFLFKTFYRILFYYFSSTFFFIVSFINICLFRFRSSNKANYFIFPEKNFRFDRRSWPYLNHINLSQTLNIVRSNSVTLNLLLILKIPNIVFYIQLETICKVLAKIKKKNRSIEILTSLLIFIFKFSRIKLFLSIDDYRVMTVFNRVCKILNIKIIFYMHGRFSKKINAIKMIDPYKYLVWSDFFKKKLRKYNKSISYNNIIVTGNPHLKNFKNDLEKDHKNILFIGEKSINIKHYLQIVQILGKDKIKFYYKLKPSEILQLEIVKSLQSSNITVIDSCSLASTLRKFRIGFVVGNDSTALLEALFFLKIPITLNIRLRLNKEYAERNQIYKLNNLKKIRQLLNKKHLLQKRVLKNSILIWRKSDKKVSIKKALNKFF